MKTKTVLALFVAIVLAALAAAIHGCGSDHETNFAAVVGDVK